MGEMGLSSIMAWVRLSSVQLAKGFRMEHASCKSYNPQYKNFFNFYIYTTLKDTPLNSYLNLRSGYGDRKDFSFLDASFMVGSCDLEPLQLRLNVNSP